VSGLVAAVRYLTIVPLPGRNHASMEALGRSAVWFPIVGVGLGVALALADRLTGWLFPPLLAALLTVTVWKLATGGLHLDGLADCLDGLMGRDPDHRLAIMRDSRIGAFGAMGLILFLMLEIVALAELAPALRGRALLAAPVIARATPALLARLFRPARPDGQGAAFRAGVGRSAVLLGLAIAAAAAVVGLGALGVAALAAGSLAAVVAAAFVARRLGGVTGDVLGACVELSELTVLLTVTAWTSARL
jgi:adenosylcobinamide-GDP ribazoletransferase